MSNLRSRTNLEKWVLRFFIAAPISVLIVQALAWLRFGMDMPLWDDWEDFLSGDIGSFRLSYLFRTQNDTVSPVGRFLDSLAFHWFDSNVIAYQFLTMIFVLGLLLFFQWRLLNRVLNDRVVAATCFLLSVFMLQPGTYWGAQSMGYTQAIGILCVLAILDIATQDVRIRIFLRIFLALLCTILALISGWSYVAGSYPLVVLGLVLLVISSRLVGTSRRSLTIAGLSVLIGGTITSVTQLRVLIIHGGTHRSDAPMAFPYESDFWFYLLGKIGRSLMLPPSWPLLSVVGCIVIAAIVILLISWALLPLLTRKSEINQRIQAGTVLASLSGVVFFYLLMVTAGRAHLRPASLSSPMQVFTFAFLLYHFFWVTALWPWVAAVGYVFFRSTMVDVRYLKAGLIAACVAILAYATKAGVYEHAEVFKALMERRSDGLACLMYRLRTGQTMDCGQLAPFPLDKAVFFGIDHHVSFARFLSYLPIKIGTNDPSPEFRLSNAASDQIRAINTKIVRTDNGGIKISATTDPMLLVKIPNNIDMSKCLSLSLSATLSVEKSDTAQFFYLPTGSSEYSATNSKAVDFSTSGEPKTVQFLVHSAVGFSNEFRFDPVTFFNQTSVVTDLEVRCRRRSDSSTQSGG
jgi:hypothetical protein